MPETCHTGKQLRVTMRFAIRSEWNRYCRIDQQVLQDYEGQFLSRDQVAPVVLEI